MGDVDCLLENCLTPLDLACLGVAFVRELAWIITFAILLLLVVVVVVVVFLILEFSKKWATSTYQSNE